TARIPSPVFVAGTGRPQTSIKNRSPCSFSRAILAFSSCGLNMPSLRPLAWAFSPATALPKVSASSSSKPRRWATTAAHRVRTGARLIETVVVVMVSLATLSGQSACDPDADLVQVPQQVGGVLVD